MKQHNLFAKNSARHQSIALIAGCLASLAAHGQTVVDSELFPYTLAPYVLENTNLQAAGDQGTKAYRPWFENGAWTGDLIQYVITRDGQRIIRNDVGGFPRDGADWRGVIHPDPWSARYAFDDFIAYDLAQETDENWVCAEENPTYWETRNLWTYSLGQNTRFFWDTISPEQRIALDSGVAALPDTETDPFASSTLNYIRGDRSGERCKGGQFRMRFSLLGAIINSRPVYVPPVSDGTPDIVVVGANDGILHGFDVQDGSELFGYIPSMVLNKLRRHHQQTYKTYFVDGELRHASVDIAETPRNIVAGGLGAGAKGLFVIDVTTPTSPSVLTEISGYDRDFNGGSYEPAIGHIHGRPTIAQLPDSPRTPSGGWYVVTGNGYDSDSGIPQLALIPVNGGTVQLIPAVDPAFPDDANLPNGLSAPALVDRNGDDVADVAYAGDLQGRLWRFDLAESTAKVLFDAGSDKPITVEPDVAQHPTLGGYLVFFGTGQLLNEADASDPAYPTQSMFGIWDLNGELVTQKELVPQTIQTLTVEKTIPKDQTSCSVVPPAATDTSTIRIIPNQGAPDWTNQKGWQVDLPALSGERIVRPAQVRAKRIQFVTTNPLDIKERDPDAEKIPADAGSWMMQLDLETGANPRLESNRRALFDLNKNCALDDDDAVAFPSEVLAGETQSFYFPVGLNLGPFNIAQPAFARVAFDQVADSAIDGVYINALRLPNDVVTAPPFTGPIDVTTDVPAGNASLWHQYAEGDEGYPGRGDGFYPEPAKYDATGSPQRAFQDGSSPIKPYIDDDGPGNRVNGHAAGYNQVHGVNFIDFINLEPRRDQFRLDVGSVFEDTDQNIQLLNPRKAEQELYRVDEVLDMDQSFIVVLANADLSANNEIRIGCRSWPVYEYQTMVMEQLRTGTGLVGYGDSLSGFTDLQGESLVVKLSDFFDDTGAQQQCGDGELKTLRITPTQRVGADGTLLGTLPGCVNNTHAYTGETKIGAETATREQLYAVDPHVTPNQEGSGYRWRNGALTIQLLKVEGETARFTLQDREDLPVGATKATGQGQGSFVPREGEDLGFGGVYAKGFEWVPGEKNNTLVFNPIDPSSLDNGLLYESSVFWHWGDLTRLQSRGVSRPATPACYSGAPPLQFNRELGPWLKQQQYDGMTEQFSEELQRQYAQLLEDIRLGVDVENNINLLQALFGTTVGNHANHVFTISDYHKLRIYVPNSPGLDLIPLDQGVTFDSEDAGTPVDVADVERDLLPSLGPNFQPGRRSWIDITPE